MYIKIKVITNAREERVEQVKKDEWKLWVQEKPEMNSANARILAIMRGYYPNTKVRIVSGHHSPSKILAIDFEKE